MKHRRVVGGWICISLLSAWAPAQIDATSPAGPPSTASEVVMIESTGEAGRNWPRWRGPSGQGVVNGSDYPVTWSADQNVLWKVKVPGYGNSSPIVWGDRICLTTSFDAAPRARDSDPVCTVLCYSKSDGKLLWRTRTSAQALGKPVPNANPAVPTPTTDGERIYAYFGSVLVALEMDGRIAWERSLVEYDVTYSISSSPLLYEDQLIVVFDQPSAPSFIAAFEKDTGRELWRTPRVAERGWSSPIAVSVAGRDQIIIAAHNSVQAYQPTTGEEVWTVDWKMGQTIPTPVVGHGLVLFSSLRGRTFALRPDGQGNITETHVPWRFQKGAPFMPSPVLEGDYFYLVSGRTGIVTCGDARTGKVLWQARLRKPSKALSEASASHSDFFASPVVMEGKVFITSTDGETFVLKSGPEFELLHVNRLGDWVRASPALADGRWYFRTRWHLVAIGAGS